MTMLVSNSDDSGCDSFLLFLAVDVATTITCRDLTVLPFAKIYHVATSILLPVMLIFVATTFFWPL